MRKGSLSVVWGYMLKKCVVAKVSLWVSLISPLSYAQLCIEQFRMWAVFRVALSLHTAWCTLHTQGEQSLLNLVYQSFDRTSIYTYMCVYVINYIII
jgi:hypothetical protein